MQIASVLEGRIPGEVLPDDTRESLIHAIIRFAGPGDQRDRALYMAAALGGSGEGNFQALLHLGATVRESRDPIVRSAAAQQLGKIATIGEMIEHTGLTPGDPPSGPDDARAWGGFLGGLRTSLERNPEEAPIAVAIFDEVRSRLLESLIPLGLAELESTYRLIAETAPAEVAIYARKALRGLELR